MPMEILGEGEGPETEEGAEGGGMEIEAGEVGGEAVGGCRHQHNPQIRWKCNNFLHSNNPNRSNSSNSFYHHNCPYQIRIRCRQQQPCVLQSNLFYKSITIMSSIHPCGG